LQNTVSAAAFGQATIPITDALRLTLGGRYTWDRARFSGFSSRAYTQPNSLDAYPDPFFFVSYPKQSASWKQFTPKVSVDYKIDDTLLYATYSKGFKAGTFNINSPSNPGPVNPEILTAYELGSKSDFFDGRVRINAAAYLYNYKDLQVTSVLNSGNTKLANAAKARIYGFDFSPTVLIASGLIFSAGLEYNHSRYTDFPHFAGELPAAVGNTPADIDATGHQLSHAPQWTTNASLDYTRSVGSAGTVHGTVNWYRNGGFFWDAQNVLKQNPYDVLNVSVAFSTPDDRWTFALWGTNLTNTFYETAALAFGPGTVAFDAPPRMFGAKLTHAIR
jgi:iron complex outermembrane recepter protein